MKYIIFTILIFFSCIKVFSQDTIYTLNGRFIPVKIIESSLTDITFKPLKSRNDTVYTIKRSMISMIKRESGSIEIVNSPSDDSKMNPDYLISRKMYNRGTVDARKYYSKHKAAGTVTLITSSLLTPVAGLIPAISFSAKKPDVSKFQYPSDELIKNTDYFNGYAKETKKIKREKVWSNWGLGLGTNLLVLLLIYVGTQ